MCAASKCSKGHQQCKCTHQADALLQQITSVTSLILSAGACVHAGAEAMTCYLLLVREYYLDMPRSMFLYVFE